MSHLKDLIGLLYIAICSAVTSLLGEFWAWRLRESPEFATQCGVHDYDDRLDDYSLQALEKRKVCIVPSFI